MEGTLISVKDASARLQVSEQRVRALCRDRKIDAQKVGSAWIIKAESLNSARKLSERIVAAEKGSDYKTRPQESSPIALSFFSGAMGLDLGIEKAGFQIPLACEADSFCRETIALNKPEVEILEDINNYSAQDILASLDLTTHDEIDLVVGGPPCQAFSTAGKRKAFHDSRGNVFLKYVELALQLRPKFILIENVRGLLSCPMKHRPHTQRGTGFPDLSHDELKGGALNFILHRIRKAGYSYSFNLYNAANFGAPQVRERVIILCARDERKVPFIPPTHSQKGEFGLKKWLTLQDVISDIRQHNHVNFPENRLKYYRMLKSGQNWRNLPTSLQREALGKSYESGGGKTGFLRRLAWDKPSPTLVTHPAMPATDLCHPTEDRPLSIQEYKRIQQFPDDWFLAGPLTERYKQIGNAVPVSLGYAVGKLIIDLINGTDIPIYKDFQYSRYKKTSHFDWENEFRKTIERQSSKSHQLALSFTSKKQREVV